MRCIFSFLAMLAGSLFVSANAQNIPVINSEIVRKVAFTDQDVAEATLADAAFAKREKGEQLSAKEQKIIELVQQKYEASEIDEGYLEYPWLDEIIGCSWYCGADYETHVSSALKNTATSDYSSASIFDADLRTAWVEGAKGYGIGESIELRFRLGAPQVTTCFITNGYGKNESTWRNNSRVKTFNVYDSEKLVAVLNLQDTRDIQGFELLYPMPGYPQADFDKYKEGGYEYDDPENIPRPYVLKFVITEVYKGDKYDDTAISEFSFSGIGVHCLVAGTAISMADNSEKDIASVQIGDVVLAYNTTTKKYENSRVVQKHQASHRMMYSVKLQNGIEIVCTADHPFFTPEGWMSINPYKTKQYPRYRNMKIDKYKVGDALYLHSQGANTTGIIQSIDKVETSDSSYTLELDIEGAFVANSVLVGQE